MNKHLQQILDTLLQIEGISDGQKSTITKSLKDAEKELTILEFKLDRREQVKRTTAILLEETIEELELKRKAIKETNLALQKSLEELKSAQEQLVQQEKLASLGQLTAGIVHEIQHPLNFVNNFSELDEELNHELELGNLSEAKEIIKDLMSNEVKIKHHGKHAESVVKSMLQKSRTNSGERELTDINALCDEYFRLAYHACLAGRQGIRAKDKSFNAKFEMNFPDIAKINVVPQYMGEVPLNLINDTFYACTERSRRAVGGKNQSLTTNYEPSVSISTKKINDQIEICVSDNGEGIPDNVKDKIFQPFFTTKPTGEGTGLGLSLSYDIIKSHGGEMMVETKSGEDLPSLPTGQSVSAFIIKLPIDCFIDFCTG